MSDRTKILTCSYCGNRAMLCLRGKIRHELSCAACAAPLHLMKQLQPAKETSGSREKKPKKTHTSKPRRKEGREDKRRRKPVMRALFAKVWDEIEDIFD